MMDSYDRGHRALTPLIFESGQHGERAYDVFSKLMTQRIIFLGEVITPDVANIVCAQLNFLDDGSPIDLYINSPGGYVTAGMAIYDTMNYIESPVRTLCIGQAASMAAILLLSGSKGMRRALPNAEIMLHQPWGDASGKTTDIERAAKHMIESKKRLNRIVSKHTGMKEIKVTEMLEWDWHMTPAEARENGVIDDVLSGKRKR